MCIEEEAGARAPAMPPRETAAQAGGLGDCGHPFRRAA